MFCSREAVYPAASFFVPFFRVDLQKTMVSFPAILQAPLNVIVGVSDELTRSDIS